MNGKYAAVVPVIAILALFLAVSDWPLKSTSANQRVSQPGGTTTVVSPDEALMVTNVEQVTLTNCGRVTVQSRTGEFDAYSCSLKDIQLGALVKVVEYQPGGGGSPTRFIYEIGATPPGPRVISPGR